MLFVKSDNDLQTSCCPLSIFDGSGTSCKGNNFMCDYYEKQLVLKGPPPKTNKYQSSRVTHFGHDLHNAQPMM